MSAQTVITHAPMQEERPLMTGTRVHYTGSQDWGPATVTIVKPWGASHYVVRLNDGREYVSRACDVAPVGVSLAKITDHDVPLVSTPRVRSAWLLKRNDLDLFADWFELTLSRARRLGHVD